MAQLIERIKENPAGLISKEFLESDEPLSLVKTYFDDVIHLQDGLKTEKQSFKSVIDEIAIEGLDANQVWWQAKMVLDNIGGELVEKIATLKKNMADDGDDIEDEELSENEEPGELDSEAEEASDEEASESETIEGVEQKDVGLRESDDEEVQSVSELDGSSDVYSDEDETLNNVEDPSKTSQETYEDAIESLEPDNEASDKYGINDDFFELEEFNRQTLAAEDSIQDQEDHEEDEEIDYFDDLSSDDDEEVLYYDDFFEPPKTKNSIEKSDSKTLKSPVVPGKDLDEDIYETAIGNAKLDLFAEQQEEEDSDNELNTDKQTGKKFSTFELQQLQIQREIEQLEKEAVAQKKWALKGEVKAKDRPEDALLTEELEFDRTAKPVPVITAEITESLEDMIRRRIKDGNFDDLNRRIISDISSFGGKQKVELSDVKSSKSLAEIYEGEYKGVSEETELSEELLKSHDEITDLYKNLVYKLDALSSASFIPKPVQKSLEVKVQTASIAMEDAQPLTMSSSTTLAPQEIYRVGKSENKDEITLKNGVVMSKEELSREDKNRLRRAIKRKRSKALENNNKQARKKSKKDDVLDTLSKAKNVTIIDKKGEKRDTKGNAKGAGRQTSSTNLKL
ncbi:rRNA-processing protein MPP10 Ecym_8271 [Eremothecium cymbalariae DBVPG|uniref:U3 small nucleolar ribonucleoprotein protein MPP10 n=1 Tax=Eremothecium cymbalariae (strain CBS 270.75 / DBVPG 7215 / KCTC 17166 / NRRL Y-17582) TaxID=931890 RepID=G8JXH9_ERECY|nr:Hypothetical protein Ecym_8271 [Eremothecium cymbalariae DBVPG\